MLWILPVTTSTFARRLTVVDDVRTWTVPGRVNLIGGHLDYNGGPVLPMAIDKHLTVKARLRDDGLVNVWSGLGSKVQFSTDIAVGDSAGWAGTVAGAVWVLGASGHTIPGADLVIESDIPVGAGLSSSAAAACGTVLALADLIGIDLPRTEVASLARRAETDFLGAPVGIMDQLAVLHDGANLIDTRSLEMTPVPISWDGLSLVVINTGVTHSVAAGEYAARHAECRSAAKQLELEHLSDAGLDSIYKFSDDDVLKKRVRHVVTETTRVRGAVRAITAGDWNQFGTILNSSHESLRDDFQVSCGELDVAVEAALEGGALGARMTGAGFGGSVIALAPTDQLLGLREKVVTAFAGRDWQSPTLFTTKPAAGATLEQ